MRRLILVFAVMGVAVLLASGAALGITNGTPDTTNRYRNVGAMVDPGGFKVGDETQYTYCTGTLISDTIFLTAAHCYPERGDGVTFDAKYDPQADPDTPHHFYSVCQGTKQCTDKNQEGYPFAGEFVDDPFLDIAVVKFDKPIDITPAQLPSLNRLEEGDVGKGKKYDKFTAVGYGDQATSFKDTNVYKDQRMYASSAYKSVNRTYLSLSQNIHQGNGGTCYGDSGGPNFFGAGATEEPVIAGITITGDTWCKATNVTLRLDTEPVQKFLSDYVTVPPEQPLVP
jgi:V8-like Glu-specific endopeptidase